MTKEQTDEIAELQAERDTYKQALDDLGVTPDEAKKGVARSKAVHAERDALAEQVKVLRDALVIAEIGSCHCQVKSPDIKYHTKTCPYRIIGEALAIGDGK